MKKLFLLLAFHILLLTFHLSLFTVHLSAQVTQEWVRRYSGLQPSYGSSGLSVKLDGYGNVYVLARAGTDTTYSDYCVVKYSPSGNFIWQAVYNSVDDAAKAFIVTSVGDVYVTGSSGIDFDYHILTVKFNSSGIFQWARSYNAGGPGDGAYDIALDKQGNVIIAGGSAVNSNTGYALTIKYAPNGDSLWVRKYTQYQYSINNKLVTDDSSNIYTTGYHKVNTMQSNFLTLKYNQNGSLMWYSSYGLPPSGGSSQSIAIDTNRNVYVIGHMYTLLGGHTDNVLVKLNTDGAILWTSTYTGIGGNHSSSNTPTGVSVTPDGSAIYYATACENETLSSADIVTLKYNSFGDSVWVRRFPTGEFGIPQYNPAALKHDRFYNVYVLGDKDNPSTGVKIKYSPNGIQQWVVTSDSASKDIIFDTSSSFYVTGGGRDSNNVWAAVTVKYNQPIGIISQKNQMPAKFTLNQNYPNPFNSTTIITYELPKRSNIKIEMYNIIGQLVKTIVNRTQNAGYYSIVLNLENIASGIYFYRLVSNNLIIDAKKLILIK